MGFFVDGGGIIQRHLHIIVVEIILSLLGHGEGPRDSHLDASVGVSPQELDVLNLDRMLAPDRACNPGDGVGLAGAVHGHARIIKIDTVQGCGKPVGIALAARFTVGDNIKSCYFLLADCDQGRVVLSFNKLLGIDAP